MVSDLGGALPDDEELAKQHDEEHGDVEGSKKSESEMSSDDEEGSRSESESISLSMSSTTGKEQPSIDEISEMRQLVEAIDKESEEKIQSESSDKIVRLLERAAEIVTEVASTQTDTLEMESVSTSTYWEEEEKLKFDDRVSELQSQVTSQVSSTEEKIHHLEEQIQSLSRKEPAVMLTEDCQTDFDFVPKTDFDSALSDLSKAREENELMQKKLEEAETKARDIQEEFDN